MLRANGTDCAKHEHGGVVCVLRQDAIEGSR